MLSGPDESPVSSGIAVTPWEAYSRRRRWSLLAILFLLATSNFFDKNIISVLFEPIKHNFHVSDTLLGLLSGFCFALFYAMAGLPVARWADRGNRRTVITCAVAVWSIMTVLCGCAQTFWQLALARVGVGAGESGTVPSAHSLIADYFPPERRATAIGVFTASGTMGYLLGLGLGGYIAASYGWRAAFWLAGAPGVLLAIIARAGLAEPRLKSGYPASSGRTGGVRTALVALMSKGSYRWALLGAVLYTFIVQGALLFVPSFLVRVLHSSLAEAGLTYGAVAAVGSVAGTLTGGWAADRLRQRDLRWLAWLPAFGCVTALPFYLLAFSAERVRSCMLFVFLGQVLLSGVLPPMLAGVHAVCGKARRAVAIALIYFAGTLLGSGLGPLVTGGMSDALSARYGEAGLRYALMVVVTILVCAGAAFCCCQRSMRRDEED